MRCSTSVAITWHNRRTLSEFEGGWRINNFMGRLQNDRIGSFSNFSYTHRRADTKFEKAKSPRIKPFD
jgi:hypothetical protein